VAAHTSKTGKALCVCRHLQTCAGGGDEQLWLLGSRDRPGAGATADWVRRLIHEFNDIGLESLIPAWGGGRPRQITTAMRVRITEIATTHPQELGESYASWSLSTLRAYLLRHGVVPAVSEEHLRRILVDDGCTTAATKSWKTSPDPDFDIKARRLRRLFGPPRTEASMGCLCASTSTAR
jgi:transposase